MIGAALRGCDASGGFSLLDSTGAGLSGKTFLYASWMDAEGRWHGWAELAWSPAKGPTRSPAATACCGQAHIMAKARGERTR